jgi:hypothetical protein
LRATSSRVERASRAASRVASCARLTRCLTRMRPRDRVPSLVIDASNQVVPGLAPHESVSSWLRRSAAGVRRILALARLSGLRPVFVTESPFKSAKQLEKFRKRHGSKLRRGRQVIPFDGTLMVCEQALRAGAMVLCDEVHEADLVVASYVLHSSDESRVLSCDSDFGRYEDGALHGRVVHARVVHAVLSGEPLELYVTPLGRPEPRHSLACLPVEALPVPPAARTGAELARRCLGGSVMVRGAVYPSAELRGCGSLLLAARGFRRALYRSTVREVWPR